MQVEVEGKVEVREFEKTNPETGEVTKYKFMNQSSYLHVGGKYPIPFNLDVEDEEGFEPGLYDLHPSSIQTDRGRLNFARNLTLVKVK